MRKFSLRGIGVADARLDARPALHDCIEIVLQEADVLMDDVLIGLAKLSAKIPVNKTANHAVSPQKIATDLLCSQGDGVKRAFMAHLRRSVFRNHSPEFVEQPLVRFEDLQLLDAQQIDASIEFALAQQEVSRCVDDVVAPFNAFISSLLGWITVQPHLNPLKPDVFIHALQASIAQHVPDEQKRSLLITPAAGLMGVSLRQLYREVNDWLRSQGVEPALPEGATAFGGSAGRGSGSTHSVTRTLVTLDKLRKLLSGELDTGAGVQDFLHTVPASFVAMEDLKLVEPMMKRLAAMRASRPEAAPPARVGLAMEREPTQRKQMGKQLGEEVVRMMLDNLMQDQRLLLSMRQLIKTLEPVLLALAQTDPRFFSDRQHPARLFLDRVTDRSLGYANANDEGFARFLKSISNAIGVLTGGAGDAASFARILSKLEASWNRDEAVLRQRQEESARALLHVEQRNLLAQRIADDFSALQAKNEIPELVMTFLRGPWAQVVAQSQLGCVDGSTDTEGYLALVDDLVWSVQIRLARRNRSKLVQLIPQLLGKLRQGLQLIQYPPERVAAFFDALIALHEQVFEGPRAQPSGECVGSTDTASTSNNKQPPEVANVVPEAAEFWVANDEAQDACYMPEEVNPADPGVQRNTWSVRDLSAGMWVELVVDGEWLRAQLTWTSPHRTLFMFVSRGGVAHSMSRRTMERLRMQDSIRVVSDGHLVDNALDAVAQTALQNELQQNKPAP